MGGLVSIYLLWYSADSAVEMYQNRVHQRTVFWWSINRHTSSCHRFVSLTWLFQEVMVDALAKEYERPNEVVSDVLKAASVVTKESSYKEENLLKRYRTQNRWDWIVAQDQSVTHAFMLHVLNGFHFYDLCHELWSGFARSSSRTYTSYTRMAGYLLVTVRRSSVLYNGYEIPSVYGGTVARWMISKREWNHPWRPLCNVAYFMSEDFDY